MKSKIGLFFVALSALVVVGTIGRDIPLVGVSDAAAEAPLEPVKTKTCPENSEDTTLSTDPRCIGLREMTTRGRLRANCFADPQVSVRGATYRKSDCRGATTNQIEAIAHVRATMRLSGSPLGTVDPGYQYEVAYPGYRPDLIRYTRSGPVSASPLEIVEVKKIEFDGTAEIRYARNQLNGYLATIPRADGRTAQELNLAGYFDSFLVVTQECENSSSKAKLDRYDVAQSLDGFGLLLTRRVAEIERNCDGKKQPIPDLANEPSYEVAYEAPLPDVADEKPVELRPPGRDDDGNGQDDLIDDLKEWSKKLYPEWQDDDGPVPPISGLPSDFPTLELTPAQMALVVVAVVAVIGVAVFVATGGLSGLLGLLATPGVLQSASAMAAAFAGFLLGLFGLSMWGDPHIVTLDNLAYDLQAVGEFHLLEIPSQDIDLQGRFVGQGTSVSLVSATAFDLNGEFVQIDGDTLRVNRQIVDDEGPYFGFGDGASIVRSAAGWIVTWPGVGERVTMVQRGQDIAVHVPEGVEDVRGLLGDANGDPLDDLEYRDGTPIAVPASPSALHGTFADSWRIAKDESFFAYAPGQTTADFTDLAFPSQILTLGDFTTAEVAAAEEICVESGVVPGPQFEDCLFDVAATGDAAYAESAALVTDPLIDGTEHSFDSSGALSEDFEGAVAPNFSTSRYTEDPLTTRLAGPLFDTPGYQLYARSVGEFQRSVHGPGMIAGAVDHHRPLENPGCQARRCRCPNAKRSLTR